ncbi:MAG: AbrB/MazE/SpoVT family DNA-binding domain-containing protein [Deltaproteobacteria bacterium]|nr:AbrB/MazE/SpoVT family DNA-binding domain-containing protein [Deltaproteobacteria bacterium]MBW2070586.1 AbrB/MazE/SpoVT family DNA-binding domain-containing protein [Deltaproteobacteria bacterium]
MKVRIQKWGNSLALRIPKAFAAETNLKQNSLVEISLVEGKIVVSRASETAYSLEDLLVGVTEENRHSEIDFGPPVGKEIW